MSNFIQVKVEGTEFGLAASTHDFIGLLAEDGRKAVPAKKVKELLEWLAWKLADNREWYITPMRVEITFVEGGPPLGKGIFTKLQARVFESRKG